jgi:hypothetical protein
VTLLATRLRETDTSGRVVIRQKIGQSDLAALTGIARETVSRILNDFSGYYCLENKAQLARQAQR